jgi:hypothetical protein
LPVYWNIRRTLIQKAYERRSLSSIVVNLDLNTLGDQEL